MRGLDREMVAELGAAQVRCIALIDATPTSSQACGDGGPALRGETSAAWSMRCVALPAPMAPAVRGQPCSGPVGERSRRRGVGTNRGSGAHDRRHRAGSMALRCRSDTLLVDADTIGPSVAQHLGLHRRHLRASRPRCARRRGAGSIPTASRLGRVGAVRFPSAGRVCRPLTGGPSCVRHRSAAMLRCARSTVAWTVVDVGFGVEGNDLALGRPGNSGQVRGGAHRAGRRRCRRVRRSPRSGRRCAACQGVREVSDLAPAAALVPVVNRVRSRTEGAEVAGVVAPNWLSLRCWYCLDDPRAVGSAMAHGVTVAETSPRSAFAQGIEMLGGRVLAAVEFVR